MVEVQDVHKRFGKLQVLKGVSASFEAGKVTALVGPNASGKSTLMKSILGLVLPEKGEVTIQGRSVRQHPEVKAALGYMPQKPNFPDNLQPRELFRWLQDMRGARPQELAALQAYFGLEPHLKKPMRVLSGGTQQKVSAVLALLFDPLVLIMDEPTAGLDPQASSRFKDRILVERDAGKTIIISSHVMSELEELVDEVLFLLAGSVVFRGTLAEIRSRTQETKLERGIAKLMAHEAPEVGA